MPRILVVDDEEQSRALIVRILTGGGYEIIQALDGHQGLEMIRKEMPDLVVLDLNLPGVDGYEVCRQIKSDPVTQNIPIVMVTAQYSSVQDAKRGLKLGAVEYVVKPFAAQVLLHNVERLLRRRQ